MYLDPSASDPSVKENCWKLSNAFFENLSVRFESCLPSFTIQLVFVAAAKMAPQAPRRLPAPILRKTPVAFYELLSATLQHTRRNVKIRTGINEPLVHRIDPVLASLFSCSKPEATHETDFCKVPCRRKWRNCH